MTNFKYILDDVALGEMVYILYLKEYWIQPLSYSELGIELSKSNNPSITDTPRGTTGHVVDLCLGGGDLEDLTGYYQRHGLLWLKQYIENILQHL